jgi:anti-sigma regulatory factor (Ser/Thr protein kinase)
VTLKSTRVTIDDASHVGHARRTAVGLAAQLGIDDAAANDVAIVATEAATNLVQHARHGEILLRPIVDDEAPGIELLALDRGPGVASVDDAMRDGYSTAGTRGAGLGAIQRLSTVFDMYSTPDSGTAVLSQVHARPLRPGFTAPAIEVGAVCVALPGEDACGDDWALVTIAERAKVMVADGLGHGPVAAEAAGAAARAFRESAGASLEQILRGAHAALHSTRGAALAIAELDPHAGTIRFAGVGNVAAAAVMASGDRRSMVSLNGIVGHEMRRVREMMYPWPDDALVLVHTDGLGTHWQLARYPGLHRKHPSLVAGILYRDHWRQRDDVTVVVARRR